MNTCRSSGAKNSMMLMMKLLIGLQGVSGHAAYLAWAAVRCSADNLVLALMSLKKYVRSMIAIVIVDHIM